MKKLTMLFVTLWVAGVTMSCATKSVETKPLGPKAPIGPDYGIVIGRIVVKIDNFQGINTTLSSNLSFHLLYFTEDAETPQVIPLKSDERGYFYRENIPLNAMVGLGVVDLSNHYVGADKRINDGVSLGDDEKCGVRFGFGKSRSIAMDINYTVNSDGSTSYSFRSGSAEVVQWFTGRYPESSWIPIITQPPEGNSNSSRPGSPMIASTTNYWR